MLERNGIDMEQYFESFDNQSLHSIMQYLEATGADKRVEGYLRMMLAPDSMEPNMERLETARGPKKKKRRARRPPKRARGHKKRRPRVHPLWGEVEISDGLLPTGFCECGGIVAGVHMPTCEYTDSGRFYYQECNTCPYWTEIFLKEGKFVEIKGGEANGNE